MEVALSLGGLGRFVDCSCTSIFNATTVSEVMDMRDRRSQEDFLNKIYSNPGVEAINSYLDVVERLERAAYEPLPVAHQSLH